MTKNFQTPKSALINVMSAAVYKAARGLVRDFGELSHLQITRKSIGDFVSSADKRSEQILIDELRKARPDFCFLCEEAGEIKGHNASFSKQDRSQFLQALDMLIQKLRP